MPAYFKSVSCLVLLSLLLAGCSQQPQVATTVWTGQSDRIQDYYQRWQGTPYRLGGTDQRGLDCSAFVQNLYADVFAHQLPRTTEAQVDHGYAVLPGELEPGDLVFFKTGWRTRHVGVYIGQGQFVHASTSMGVTRSSLYNDYWRDTYWQARRLR